MIYNKKLNNKTFTHYNMIQIYKFDNTLTRGILKAEKNLKETYIKYHGL